MRIVEDPDPGHVWLITPAGTFRELTDSEPDGVYETVRPTDDRRLFEKITGGWTITELDGTVHSFDADGKWVSSIDRFGDGPSGTYNGSDQLTSVDFADDRVVELTYHASGKLATMTEVGTDMTTTRTWSYTWSGHDLVRIDRPDDTAWAFAYGEPRFPFMTRQTQVGSGSSPLTRIEAAWDYDNTTGFLIDVWTGDADKNATAATDRYSFDRSVPGETTVTDPLGSDTVWTWDEVGGKPRVLARSGDCPQCSAPNEVSYTYTDANNLLRPTSMLGPDGATTSWTYDADSGMPLSKTEDDGGTLARVSTWLYHPTYPGLVRFASRPATDPTCTNIAMTTSLPARTTELIYESAGTGPRLIETFEQGCRIVDANTLDLVTFGLSTYRDYTGSSSGLPTSIDPPRLGSSADATTFTLTANDQLIATRTVPDPAAGGATTTYTYDAYNRRIGVTDANGHTTETQYDQLDRVTRVIERSGAFTYGSGPNAGDLATTYTYDTIGDLELIELPEGNAIFHVYDHVGRLTERHRRATAGGANLERTTWTYDDMGHRTREEHANLVGGTTVTSATEWSYANGCQLNAVVHNPSPFGSGDVVTSYDYDCEGRLWKTWDANHPMGTHPNEYTEYEYDALDRLWRVTQPWGVDDPPTTDVVTTYGYDSQDHLTSVLDGEGNETTYRYSDRDLLMVEDSPVSGETVHLYNTGGELTLTKDARDIETTRTIDAAGRVTLVEYSGNPDLDVAFTYGSSAVADEIGRLIGITRHGATIDYEYDEFGRTIRDGGLVFGYDDNGNRTSITYPDGLLVEYTFDHADREQSLTADPSGENLSVVSAASYLPAGPLSGLTFGNGRSEERAFTGRYFPERITLEPGGGGSALLDWEYVTDDVGNPTEINDLVSSPDRSYTYQDHQYFLDSASGPWPGPLSWSYDRIGNRLSETRDTNTDDYLYAAGTSGNTAILASVDLAVGGTRDYSYTPAGHVMEVDAGANVVDFLVDEEGRLGGLERVAGDAGSSMLYDGRGFLARVEGFELSTIFRDGFERETTECWSDGVPTPPSPGSPCSSAFRIVEPVYDSAGLLHALGITETLLGSSTERVLYLAGRPVAIAKGDVGALGLLYLTTDHLGTPIAACDDSGTLQWSGGLEPFGTDWLAGTSGGASENGVWLRFSGQWEDPSWTTASLGVPLLHNVFRWASGDRYARPDPIGLKGRLPNLYSYVGNRPTVHVDSLGLQTCVLFVLDPVATIREARVSVVGHVAIMSGGACEEAPPILYDPAGSFRPETEPRGSGDVFTGGGASIPAFRKYHEEGGSEVEVYCFDTSCCEEQEIQTRIFELGGVSPGLCSAAVGSCIEGVGPFGSGQSFFPAPFRRRIRDLHGGSSN